MSDLEMKSFGPFEIKSEDRGEVEAIVATLGVVDKDRDVILPGAFPPGGSKVKLSGYRHDIITEDAPPAGKGVIFERDGKAVFAGKFFMSTQRGREAFFTTKEMGEDGEWSFGFPRDVKVGELTEEWKAKGAKRIITGILPIEASPVLVGAGQGTGTLLAKAAEDVAPEPGADGDPTPPEPEFDAEAVAAEAQVAIERGLQAAMESADREAEAQMNAAKAEAMEEYARVQRALKRMGYAA
jgi:hypothetical protein